MKKILVLESSSIIIGGMIGAGILGLPFAFMQSGFWTGLLVLGLIGLCVTILNLCFGEVILRTKQNHQLLGYTDVYLGKTAKYVQGVLLLLGIYAALLAYTIGLGQILENLTGINAFVWSLLSYALLSYFVIRGLETVKKIEFFVGFMILGLLFTLALLSAQHINLANWQGFSWATFFVPFGAILFACSGMVAIPEAREVLQAGKQDRHLAKAILIGTIVPILIYVCFTAIVVAVTGLSTTQIATIGLSNAIGPTALLIGSLFSIVAMSSSFLTLGVALKESFQFDFSLKPTLAAFAALVLPIALYLFGVRNFFAVVSLGGALSIGLGGLMSLAIFWRARARSQRKPEYTIPLWLAIPSTILIAAVFIAGLMYTL